MLLNNNKIIQAAQAVLSLKLALSILLITFIID